MSMKHFYAFFFVYLSFFSLFMHRNRMKRIVEIHSKPVMCLLSEISI